MLQSRFIAYTMQPFCFVISHYAQKPEHQVALQHCVQSIRELYGHEVAIHVIDDYSPVPPTEVLKEISLPHDQGQDTRLYVHKNPMPQSGEFGVLYWYLQNPDLAPEPYAYCIHDSMVCRKAHLPKSSEWLWYFDRAHGYHHAEIRRHLSILRASHGDVDAWWSIFLNQFTKQWVGCFGISCYIARKDLQMLQTQYSLFDSIQYVNTREDRQAMERLFALFYCHTIPPRALCGNIFDHPEMSQSTLGALAYADKLTTHSEYDKPFLKTWFGR